MKSPDLTSSNVWLLCLSYIDGSVYFAVSGKSSAETILSFESYPALSTYNAELMT